MLKPTRVYEKGQSGREALIKAGEFERRPCRRTKPSRKRGAVPSKQTTDRDSIVSQKLAALHRPLKPPGKK